MIGGITFLDFLSLEVSKDQLRLWLWSRHCRGICRILLMRDSTQLVKQLQYSSSTVPAPRSCSYPRLRPSTAWCNVIFTNRCYR